MQTPDFLQHDCYILGEAEGHTLYSKATLDAVIRLPRPGIMIFVHGVNSDGEWYDEADLRRQCGKGAGV